MSNPREIAERLTDRRRDGISCNGAIWSPGDALAIVKRRMMMRNPDDDRKIAAWFWMLNRPIADQPDPIELAVATLAYLPAQQRAEAIARAEKHAAVIHTEEEPS